MIESKTPFPKSYWVVPGKFLAGEIPASRKLLESKRKLEKLLHCGVRGIIDLTHPDDHGTEDGFTVEYLRLLRQYAAEKKVKVIYERIAVPCESAPSFEQMDTILKKIDEFLRRDSGIYVHCGDGLGRTGSVVGCFISSKKLANGNSIFSAIKDLKAQSALSERLSPQTAAQFEMVLEWDRKNS